MEKKKKRKIETLIFIFLTWQQCEVEVEKQCTVDGNIKWR